MWGRTRPPAASRASWRRPARPREPVARRERGRGGAPSSRARGRVRGGARGAGPRRGRGRGGGGGAGARRGRKVSGKETAPFETPGARATSLIVGRATTSTKPV